MWWLPLLTSATGLELSTPCKVTRDFHLTSQWVSRTQAVGVTSVLSNSTVSSKTQAESWLFTWAHGVKSQWLLWTCLWEDERWRQKSTLVQCSPTGCGRSPEEPERKHALCAPCRESTIPLTHPLKLSNDFSMLFRNAMRIFLCVLF